MGAPLSHASMVNCWVMFCCGLPADGRARRNLRSLRADTYPPSRITLTYLAISRGVCSSHPEAILYLRCSQHVVLDLRPAENKSVPKAPNVPRGRDDISVRQTNLARRAFQGGALELVSACMVRLLCVSLRLWIATSCASWHRI